jgi:predicted 2-oxoglutarate/Fe(II)-dependent dioxygenase YbiX
MHLAVLIVPAFLDPAACHRIRAAMEAGSPEPADVLEREIALDLRQRRAAHVEVDPDTLAFLERTLDAARPRVESHFGLQLGHREGTGLLRYGAGGFYGPHRDCGDVPSWPAAARRCISIVLFLTSSREVEPTGAFTGGALRLFVDDHASKPVDVHPREGTLVAFPATMLHEVRTVHEGTRDAAVDWFS